MADIVIQQSLLADNEYVKKQTKKDTIVIHHTAGGHHPVWTVNSWGRDNRGRIATAYTIGSRSITNGDSSVDGLIVMAFDPKYWAWHLGVKGTNGVLDAKSIGIEICNYGPIKLGKDGKYYNWVNKPVPASEVYDLGFLWRGYRYFHRYTDAQIESLRHLLLFLSQEYGIDIRANQPWSAASFETSKTALSGAPGLWTHVNYRKDKSDCHPQPELIAMLNSL